MKMQKQYVNSSKGKDAHPSDGSSTFVGGAIRASSKFNLRKGEECNKNIH
jgi:hypothetical protein